MGVASSGGRHALSPRKVYFVEFYGRAEVFWLFAFYDLSRSLFWRYNKFQCVILKLNTRPFCWCNIYFCTSIGSFRILKLVGFPKWLPHPVQSYCLTVYVVILYILQGEQLSNIFLSQYITVVVVAYQKKFRYERCLDLSTESSNLWSLLQ